jgi:hypothetical protein
MMVPGSALRAKLMAGVQSAPPRGRRPFVSYNGAFAGNLRVFERVFIRR